MDWFEGGSWHDVLETTSGLTRQPRDDAPIDHNARLRRAHAACLPHYRLLHAHRVVG